MKSLHPWLRRAERSRAVRVVVLATRGFIKDECFQRAGFLSFDAILGIVPLLAFVFALVKGIGAYDLLVRDAIEPWIATAFGRGAVEGESIVTLRDAVDRIILLVDSTSFSSLGVIGLVALLYTSAALLYSIEHSLDTIYGNPVSRPLIRKASDYAALMFLWPLVAISVGTLVVSSFRWLGPVHVPRLLADFGSTLAIGGFLTVLYLVMPSERVRVRSAAIGGLVGGVLFYLLLQLMVRAQLGVARYNAIYSSFAILPLFLLWIFGSWVTVLFGAQVAAVDADARAFEARVAGDDRSFGARLHAALRLMVELDQVFLRGEPPRTMEELEAAVGAPRGTLDRLAGDLVKAGLVVRTQGRPGEGLLPAMDPAMIRLSDVRDALFGSGPTVMDPVDERIANRWDAFAHSQEATRDNWSVRRLAEHSAGQVSEGAVSEGRAATEPGQA